MCVDEVEDYIFELRQTPAHLEASIVVDRRQLSDKRLHTVIELPRLNSVQIDRKERARDLFDGRFDGFARLGDQLGVLGKKALIFFISCNRASSYCINSVHDCVFGLLMPFAMIFSLILD